MEISNERVNLMASTGKCIFTFLTTDQYPGTAVVGQAA